MQSAKYLNAIKMSRNVIILELQAHLPKEIAIKTFLNIILCYGIPSREKAARERNVARDPESMFLDAENVVLHILFFRTCFTDVPHHCAFVSVHCPILSCFDPRFFIKVM